jgi:trehalose transport system permease protein
MTAPAAGEASASDRPGPPPVHRRPRFTPTAVGFYAVIVLLSVWLLFPIYVIFLLAFTPTKFSIDAARPDLLPIHFTWQNLIYGLTNSTVPFLPSMYLSLEIAFIVGFLALAIGIPTAYGLSRLPPVLAFGLTTVMFIVNMLPSITIAIPITVPFIKAGLYGSPISIALTQELLALPVTIFLLVGAFQGLPKDLENQARVDGAGRMRAIFGNLVPLIVPALVASFLLAWMLSWDESTFALILYNPATPTLPVQIFLTVTGRGGDPVVGVAFSFIATVPVIILVTILQKYLKGEDLAAGVRG